VEVERGNQGAEPDVQRTEAGEAPGEDLYRGIEKGFDFLGYHFSPEGLSVAEKTMEKFLARAVRLYEQEQGEPFGSPLLGLYVRQWSAWVQGIASPDHCTGKHNRLCYCTQMKENA